MSNKKFDDLFAQFQPQPNEFWPTGINNLDYILGGGLPVGKIVEMHSEAGCGKTTISLQIAARFLHDGFPVAFLDVENSLTNNLKAKMGLRYYEDQKTPEGYPMFLHLTPTTFNQVEQIMDEVLKEEAGYGLIIFDSLTMTVPDRQKGPKSKAKRISDEEAGLAARIQARFLLRYKGELYRNRATMLLLNQMRTNLKGFAGNSKPAGGKALEFAADIRIGLQRKQATKVKITSDPDADEHDGAKSKEKTTGFDLTALTTKNKYAPPLVTVPLRFEFGAGVDDAFSTAVLLIKLGLIQKTGSWYLLPGMDKKVRGQAVREWVQSFPGHVRDLVQAQVDVLIGEVAPPRVDDESRPTDHSSGQR